MDRGGVHGARWWRDIPPVAVPLALGNVYRIDTGGWQDGYFTFLDLETLVAWPRPVVREPDDTR